MIAHLHAVFNFSPAKGSTVYAGTQAYQLVSEGGQKFVWAIELPAVLANVGPQHTSMLRCLVRKQARRCDIQLRVPNPWSVPRLIPYSVVVKE